MVQKEKPGGVKYVIEARFVVEGVVEKHDVIGAIFGQTEGLFPKQLELRELQKSGKIGRIDIMLRSEKDRTTGKIIVPSSLDRVETAIIAAAMETIDRVGPCEANVTIEKILDVREEKRRRIIERAKELIREWVVKETQDLEKLLEEVAKEDRVIQPIQYGPERLTASPDVAKSKELIIVEGRADVINMLRSGYGGVIALEGVKVPKTIIELTREKVTTAFLDGDRGGDLILKELLQVARPSYVARAPRGRGVEDLTPEEIKEALANRMPLEEAILLRRVSDIAKSLRGTLEAVLLSKEGREMERVPVSGLVERLKAAEGIHAVIFDGIVTGRLMEVARERGIRMLVAERVAGGVEPPEMITVRTFKSLGLV
jgi:DNA primase